VSESGNAVFLCMLHRTLKLPNGYPAKISEFRSEMAA